MNVGTWIIGKKMSESLYDSFEKLLEAAELLGYIEFASEDDLISKVIGKARPIVIVDQEGWLHFLKEISEQTKSEKEKTFVNHLLTSFNLAMKRLAELEDQLNKNSGQISNKQIEDLKSMLNRIDSIDELLKLI